MILIRSKCRQVVIAGELRHNSKLYISKLILFEDWNDYQFHENRHDDCCGDTIREMKSFASSRPDVVLAKKPNSILILDYYGQMEMATTMDWSAVWSDFFFHFMHMTDCSEKDSSWHRANFSSFFQHTVLLLCIHVRPLVCIQTIALCVRRDDFFCLPSSSTRAALSQLSHKRVTMSRVLPGIICIPLETK